jgi:hypothetical protein
VLVHLEDTNTRAGAANSTWAATLTLPVRMDNISSGSTTSSIMYVRVATIYRLGKLETNTQYGRLTTAATYNFKYGPGVLHRLVINTSTNGTLLTVYDDTSGTSNILAIVSTPATANPISLEYHIPFQNGLKVVSTGTWDVTFCYE